MTAEIQSLVKKLLQNLSLSHLKHHRAKAQKISEHYAPRAIFIRWRDSIEGQSWKEEQFLKVKGICPSCRNSFSNISDFDIDHKKPLSKFPELTIEINNLQILCRKCNTSKGDRTLDIQETVLYYIHNPLELKQIAARFGVGTQRIQGKLNSPDESFAHWSIEKDPTGIPWLSEQKKGKAKFYPAACFIDGMNPDRENEGTDSFTDNAIHH